MRPSRTQTTYKHASGRHITFSPVIDDGGEGGASVRDGSDAEVDDDAEVVFDEEDEKPKHALVTVASPDKPPMPKPRLLGVKTGRPDTHTVLPNDEHVPRAEDWLA